ncbi:hypothetical protein [Cytobacillus sp. FSL H8-0458]|uniref:hypothetical protein n=1 Tax=Cytobacillus sp. FSL H8-0458 TaxID=2975346 RepID=UPI004046E86D
MWGTGVHWYVSEEFENLSRVHDAFPDKHLIVSKAALRQANGILESGMAETSLAT